MAGRGFAALFGADAGDEDTTNAVLGQPHVETRTDQSAMAPLPERRLGSDPERGECADEPGCFRKRPVFIDMEDLDDGYSIGFRAVDQSLLTIDIGGSEVFVPVMPMCEGLLGVDNEKDSTMAGHFLLHAG